MAFQRRVVWLHACLLLGVAWLDHAWAAEQRLRVDGLWQDGALNVKRVRARDPNVDRSRVRIVGLVAALDEELRRVRVGPVEVEWNSEQTGLLRQYAVGSPVQIDARSLAGRRLVLTSIVDGDIDSPEEVGIIGAVTGYQSEVGSDSNLVELAGIPVRVPSRLYSNGRIRLGRQDDKRPDQQLHGKLGKFDVTLGGELGFESSLDANRDLDDGVADDRRSNEQAFQIETFIEFSESISGYVEVEGNWRQEHDDRDTTTARDRRLRRGESWIFIDQLFDSPFSVQIGRQNFADQREWWWDKNLDALRVHYREYPFSFELAYAREVLAEEMGKDIDAADEDISRLFATGTWDISSELQLQAFLLRQRDHSSVYRLGDLAVEDFEDKDEADLTWLGVRAQGELDVSSQGELDYWIDTGFVSGRETFYGFDDAGTDILTVSSVGTRTRSGHAYDLGASFTWERVKGWEPTFTLGHARGSGSAEEGRAFRQTGLNNNNDRFNGVDRFKYYGELTRPQLSNLSVSTLAIGFRFGKENSIEFIHHDYDQVVANSEHTLRVRPDANGVSTSLGSEWDVVLGLESSTHWEIEIVGSRFRPGSAFGDRDARTMAQVKLNYNF